MRRRDFMTLLGGAAAWPLAARAQQREQMRRIGVLIAGLTEKDSEGQLRMAAFRQRNEFSALAKEECVKAHQKRARSLLNERHESRVEFIFFSGSQNMNLNPQSTSCGLCLSALRLGVRVLGVDEYRNRRRLG